MNQELHDSLYFCQTEHVELCSLATPIPGDITDFYSALAAECGVVLVTSLFERRAADSTTTPPVVFEADGSIAGKYRKMHIPDDPHITKSSISHPATLASSLSTLRWDVLEYWYAGTNGTPEAARLMALAGADLLIYPTAIGWESSDTPEEQTRQRDAWVTIQRAHAVANGLPVVSVNRVGQRATLRDRPEAYSSGARVSWQGPQRRVPVQSRRLRGSY